jgi:hypothetical protein
VRRVVRALSLVNDAAVRLLSAVKDKFGVEVPAAMLYGESARLDDVIRFLQSHAPASSSKTASIPSASSLAVPASSSPSFTTVDWDAETTLPDDIVPFSPSSGPLASGKPASSPKRVLLTGATGFLGAFLLAELLEQEDDVLVPLFIYLSILFIFIY